MQADHIVTLRDGGPPDYTQGLCRKAHAEKTAAEAAARAAVRKATKMTPSKTAKRSPGAAAKQAAATGEGQVPSRWRLARPVAGGLAAYLGWGWWVEDFAAYVATVMAAGVVLAGGWWAIRVVRKARDRRAAAHAAAVLNVRQGLAYALQRPVDVVVLLATGDWQTGHGGAWTVPQAARVGYDAAVDDAAGSAIRVAVEAWVASKVGSTVTDGRVVHVGWYPAENVLTWRLGAPAAVPVAEPVAEPTSRETRAHGAAAEAAKNVGHLARGAWTVVVVAHDDHGPTSLDLSWPDAFSEWKDEARVDALKAVASALPGRWRADGDWDGQRRAVRLVRRPPMPTRALYGAGTPAVDSWRLPLGLDEHHEPAVWDLRTAPHILVAGETGSGKTIFLRGVVVGACMSGAEVRVCDPKRYEFIGFRGWPGVSAVATEIETIVDLVADVYATMEERGSLVQTGKAAPKDFAPLFLVLDEAREFIDRANRLWKSTGGRGPEHSIVEAWRSIARLGRKVRVHSVAGIQRPDARVVGGEARDNYGARAALGSLSQEGARMMFGRSDAGRDVPDEIKGRCTVDLGRGVEEVQVYWVPDPGDVERDNTDDDWTLIRALRAATITARGEATRGGSADDAADGEASGEPEPVEVQVTVLPSEGARFTHLSALAVAARGGDPWWVDWDGQPMQVTEVGEDPAGDESAAEVTLVGQDGAAVTATVDASERLYVIPSPVAG
jgi:hypothetical protein